MAITMKVIRLKGEDYLAFVKNINGGKHRLKKAYWDALGSEGSIRFIGPSGRFLGIVREDPGDVDPNTGGSDDAEEASPVAMEAQADAIRRMKNSGHVTSFPSPKACKCKDWPWDDRPLDDKRKPTMHHPKCAFKRGYERSKGHKITHVAAGPTLEATVHKAGKVTNPAVNRGRLQGTPPKADKLKEKVQKIPTPDRCPKCKDFTKSKRMLAEETEVGSVQHHQTCEYYKRYKAISIARASIGKPPVKPEPLQLPVMLMDLDSLEMVREADQEEIAEGRRRLRDEGTAFVEVDGAQYLCCYKDGTTLEPAEGEPETPATADTEPPAAGDDLPDNVNEADDPDLQGAPDDEQAGA